MTELPQNTLKGLHILVTRPQAQALPWAKKLEALGAQVTCQAFLSIRPVTETGLQQAIIDRVLKLDEYQKAIFVSQNAVHYGVGWLDRYWPQMPVGLQWFAVGASTALLLQQSLEHWGVAVAAPRRAMNSEALLALPELQLVGDDKILIFRGLGGRTLLGTTLAQRGAGVDYCELYERVPPTAIDAQKLHRFKASPERPVVAVHSGETLVNLCSALTEDDQLWIRRQLLLVPGERVAGLARARGFETIIVAENATHESMTGALHDWRRQHQ